MKTKILTLIVLFAAVAGTAKNAEAAVAANSNYTVLNDIKAINSIEVRGNVEVFISDNAGEQVTVYNKYYAQNALVQNKSGVLRISSYTPEKLIVWVNSQNLRSVSAYDNAEIKSFGNVSKIEFSIDLHNNAVAKLNLDAYSVRVKMRGNATAELSGNVEVFGMDRNTGSMVISNGLTVGRNVENKITETGKEQLAGA
jgi:hypothetical protein